MVDFKALAAPFDPREVLWRVGSVTKDKTKAMALAYVDARAVMDRLDAVCGPAGWQCKYSHANGKTVCDIGIKGGMSPVEWIWKADGAGDSDIEAEKGALSDAFKRAAVRWGIGRYLYEVDSPWVEIDEWKRIKQGEYKKLDMALRRHTQAILNPAPAAAHAATGSIDETKDEIARQQNAGTQPITDLKSAGRLAAEKWTDLTLGVFKMPGFDVLAYGDWKRSPFSPKGKVTNEEKLGEMREKHPDLAQKIDDAAADLRSVAA